MVPSATPPVCFLLALQLALWHPAFKPHFFPLPLLPILQVLVQVFVLGVMPGLIGQVAAYRFQFGGRFAPGIVVVEVGIDLFVRGDKGFRPAEVRNRVQYNDVLHWSGIGFERHKGKAIHKPLEHEAVRMPSVLDSRSFRGTAFEIPAPQFPASGIVAEPDGIVRLSRDGVIHPRQCSRAMSIQIPLSER